MEPFPCPYLFSTNFFEKSDEKADKTKKRDSVKIQTRFFSAIFLTDSLRQKILSFPVEKAELQGI